MGAFHPRAQWLESRNSESCESVSHRRHSAPGVGCGWETRETGSVPVAGVLYMFSGCIFFPVFLSVRGGVPRPRGPWRRQPPRPISKFKVGGGGIAPCPEVPSRRVVLPSSLSKLPHFLA